VTPLASTGVSTITPPPPEVADIIAGAAHKVWAGVPIVPTMDTGASDGKYTRLSGIPTYGVSGVFDDVNDVRAHGKDERIGVEAYYDSVQFYYVLMKALGAAR
jgi:acetylornithine deacetylase/succinyl-diaminopimelate desuccinylase-like protein